MLFMIIEHFRNGDPTPVYQRFRERGRLAPESLRYVASWVTDDLRHCYQVMECDNRERQNSKRACSVACDPGFKVTSAFGISPHFS